VEKEKRQKKSGCRWGGKDLHCGFEDDERHNKGGKAIKRRKTTGGSKGSFEKRGGKGPNFIGVG